MKGNELNMKHYLPKQYFKIQIYKIHVYLELKSNLIYNMYSSFNMNDKKLLLYIYTTAYLLIFIYSYFM